MSWKQRVVHKHQPLKTHYRPRTTVAEKSPSPQPQERRTGRKMVRVGRPEKYDWEDKREICWKLYNEDRLSGNQIVDWFANHFNIPKSELPPSNQFHRKFKQWGFPSRRAQLSAEQEEKLLARIKDLFNKNLPAKKIQGTVNEEGWDLDDYHFLRFRKKHGLMLRGEQAFQSLPPREKKRKATDEPCSQQEATQSTQDAAAPEADVVPRSYYFAPEVPRTDIPPLAPEEAARREQRARDLEASSEQLLHTRKRRRRIRGWGKLPPDAPGLEPRYSSETSLDECKAFLHLSNELYNQIREEFMAICIADGVTKMSECKDGEWQAVKDKLVRQNAYLSSVLHPLQGDLDKKNIAVNCICMDVTKRIRTLNKTLGMADANNILELDPLQSKELRRIFYEVLEEDHFTTVAECGVGHVDELRQRWYARSEFLQRVMAEGDPEKLRALKVLDRDTRKRYGDDRNRANPEAKLGRYGAANNYGPGPGTAPRVVKMKRGPTRTYGNKDTGAQSATPQAELEHWEHNVATAPSTTPNQPQSATPRRTLAPPGPSWIGHPVPPFHTTTIANMVPPINFEIDPALDRPIWPPTAAPWGSSERDADPLPLSNGQSVHGPRHAHNPTGAATSSSAQATPASIPAYFRLSGSSQLVGHHPRVWIGKLASRSVSALHSAATVKAGAASVNKVHGVVKNPGGDEDSYLIENEDDLEAYLGEAGEKATFVVELAGGYA
ncbi:uncharacterized protein LTR77_004056 [Saxophila tyrrhenica]|uniref:Clr5 domain-containing protein n=1 Tax=Saxophila tyrrhenica TaxID=1690608 RepID=A0AAV9PBQ4_9PEZI|nr:hypothetical protein LTR77_004056 [Saxophila tyrrhenica]